MLGEEPPALRPTGGRIFTTGLWYHRLCRSLGNRSVSGVFTRALRGAEPEVATSAVAAVAGLPEWVGMVSFRELGWPMARLIDDGIRLNLMSLEALAAVEWLGGELCLAVVDGNPPLLSAAEERDVRVRLVA